MIPKSCETISLSTASKKPKASIWRKKENPHQGYGGSVHYERGDWIQ
jgi:hypothetical protein